MMIGSSSELDTHDDHQQSQIDIPNPLLPLPHPVGISNSIQARSQFIPSRINSLVTFIFPVWRNQIYESRVRSDHRCSSNAKLIPSHLHSSTPTPSGFRSDERNGRSDSEFRFHWSDSDKDKTGETRRPGKKRKKRESLFQGWATRLTSSTYLTSIKPKKKILENLQVESTCQKKKKKKKKKEESIESRDCV